jgi:hypothetical protein
MKNFNITSNFPNPINIPTYTEEGAYLVLSLEPGENLDVDYQTVRAFKDIPMMNYFISSSMLVFDPKFEFKDK